MHDRRDYYHSVNLTVVKEDLNRPGKLIWTPSVLLPLTLRFLESDQDRVHLSIIPFLPLVSQVKRGKKRGQKKGCC